MVRKSPFDNNVEQPFDLKDIIRIDCRKDTRAVRCAAKGYLCFSKLLSTLADELYFLQQIELCPAFRKSSYYKASSKCNKRYQDSKEQA